MPTRLPRALLLLSTVAVAAGAQETRTATLHAPGTSAPVDGGVVATEVQRTILTQGGPAGPNPGGPAAPGNPDDPRYRATYGRGFDGVVSLRIEATNGVFACTGSLIAPRQVLTAAHCVTSGSNVVTATSVDVRFQGPSNTLERTITAPGALVSVHPGYTGLVFANADLAVITLPEAAPDFATPLMLYNGPTAAVLGQAVTFVGYGSVGTGATGDQQPGYAAATRRFGYNRLEATCNASDAGGVSCINDASRSIWLSDFDNGGNVGAPVNGYNGNAICRFYGSPPGGAGTDPLLCNAGVTGDLLDEVGTGRGDSGGPALFDGMIVGVASWGARLDTTYAFGGWGTLAGHASVLSPANAAFIATIPEPGTYALLAVGLLGVAAARTRPKRRADTCRVPRRPPYVRDVP